MNRVLYQLSYAAMVLRISALAEISLVIILESFVFVK